MQLTTDQRNTSHFDFFAFFHRPKPSAKNKKNECQRQLRLQNRGREAQHSITVFGCCSRQGRWAGRSCAVNLLSARLIQAYTQPRLGLDRRSRSCLLCRFPLTWSEQQRQRMQLLLRPLCNYTICSIILMSSNRYSRWAVIHDAELYRRSRTVVASAFRHTLADCSLGSSGS